MMKINHNKNVIKNIGDVFMMDYGNYITVEYQNKNQCCVLGVYTIDEETPREAAIDNATYLLDQCNNPIRLKEMLDDAV